MPPLPSSSLLPTSSLSSSRDKREKEERNILEHLRNKVGSNRDRGHDHDHDHGMGSFADTLMQNVTIRSFRYESSSAAQSGQHQSAAAAQHSAQLILSFPVTQELCNSFNTLHGGAQATAVDIFTSVLLHQVSPVPSVTADLHVSCVSPAPLGSTVVCVCRVERASTSLQFSSCDLYREDNNSNDEATLVLVGKGLHTKYVLKRRIKGFVGDSGSSSSSDPQHGSTTRAKPTRSKL